MSALDYTKLAAECTSFIRKNYPGTAWQMRVDGEDRWVWSNLDGDLFTYDTEKEAAVDLCQDMGITLTELNTGIENA